MTFETPVAFTLVLPLLVAIVLTLRATKPLNPKALATALLRLLVVAAITTALARPYSSDTAPSQGVVALVDISKSMTDQQGDALLSNAQRLASSLNAPLKIIPFAKTSGTSPSIETSYQALRALGEGNDTSATNIEASLTAAQRLRSPLVLLLSDGYESQGHALSALSSGVGSRIFPLTTDGPPDAQGIAISQLYAPQVVKSQQRADVRVTLSSALQSSTSGQLTITHGPSTILSKALPLPPSFDTTVTALTDPNVEGLNAITATYTWTDAGGSHTLSRTTWLSSEKRDKVLLLSGTPEDDRYLSQILRGQAYQLRSELASNVSSESLGSLNDYRAVILNNVPFTAIPSATAAAIAPFVRNGGGLITIGGERSYGLGGYIGSSLETVLPVRLVPPHVEKKRLNVAVQLVVDKSRSMAMDSRLEFAKRAAREVLNSLKDDDYIGVIGFDDVPFIALPIAPVGTVRSSAVDRISRLFPTKRTNLFPALDEARRGLGRINAGRKHVIVLTDGKLPDAGPFYYDLVKQMRVLGVTLSTVVVGNDADDGFLARLAEIGGGSFYQTADPANLPKIFLSDVKIASDERSMKESPLIPVSTGPSGISSTNLSDFPPLRGFVETLPRETAKTELIVSTEGKSFPLLASWKVEKGRVLSFTSDVNGRWSSPWIPWRSINEFWSDLVESTIAATGKARANVNFDLRSWVEGGEVVVDLSIFDDIGGAPLGGSLTLPNSEKTDLSFSTVSPGHFQARVPNAAAGRYVAAITLGDAVLPEIAWEVSDETFTERPRFKPNIPLLQQIASRSGGVMNPDEGALRRSLEMGTTKRDLTRVFASLALLLFVAEILLREFGRRRARAKSLL